VIIFRPSGRMKRHQVQPPSVGPACRAGLRGLPRPVRRGPQKIALNVAVDHDCSGVCRVLPCELGSASPNVHSGRMDLLWQQFRRSCLPGGRRGLPRPVRRGSPQIASKPSLTPDCLMFNACCGASSVRLRRTSIPAEWTYLKSRRLATHGRPERCTSPPN
jgi:hypothetical protein